MLFLNRYNLVKNNHKRTRLIKFNQCKPLMNKILFINNKFAILSLSILMWVPFNIFYDISKIRLMVYHFIKYNTNGVPLYNFGINMCFCKELWYLVRLLSYNYTMMFLIPKKKKKRGATHIYLSGILLGF